MSDDQRAMLALADGTTFVGRAFGARATTTGEVVFTTAMSGYQEVLTDPSYAGQLVTMTAPGGIPLYDQVRLAYPVLSPLVVVVPTNLPSS